VVGYAPGGSIDTLARIVARHLSDQYFGSSGASSPASMQMAQLMQQTNTRMLEISYKDAAPALIALMSGEIQHLKWWH
jgi:tripartite-type tricarboxylate transporter receptor subunit TctC